MSNTNLQEALDEMRRLDPIVGLEERCTVLRPEWSAPT
jgi:hypothetical protein